MNTARILLVSLLAIATVVACGKIDNLPSERLLEYTNVLPEKPVEMGSVTYAPWTSSRGLAVRGDELLVVDKDNGDLVVMDQDSLSVTATIAVGTNPEHVLVGPSGDAWVTVRGSGEIVRVDAGNAITARTTIGSEPFAMALRAAGGERLFVSLSEDDSIVSLSPDTLALSERIEVLDAPRGIALSGDFLHVIHQHDDVLVLSLGSSGQFQRDPATSQPSTSSARLRRGIPSDHNSFRNLTGARSTRALAAAVHPLHGDVLVAHVQAHPGTDNDFLASALIELNDGPQQPSSSGYGSSGSGNSLFNVPTRPVEVSVSQVGRDGTEGEVFADHPVQDPVSGEPLTHLLSQPSDINHHPTHTIALVTGYGSDTVLVLNTSRRDPMLSPLGVVDVGWAPKAVTFSSDGSRAFVLNHQSFEVSEIRLEPFLSMKTEVKLPVLEGRDFDHGGMDFFMEPIPERADPDQEEPQQVMTYERGDDTARPLHMTASRTSSYGSDPRPADIARGQRIFTFTRNRHLSHAGQFACATCHFEGREDKEVWVVDEGPRQTPSLAGRLADTAPFNWAGTKPELQGNMSQTVERMGGQGMTAAEVSDLEAFLLSLKEVPNPNVAADGTLSDIQAWGKELFNRADVGCASCHAGPATTDGRVHDVNTATAVEHEVWTQRRAAGLTDDTAPALLNTPSLRGLFYTAPYLHDGSAETLHDVLELAPQMGHPELLGPEERDALVAYLLTL